MLLPTVQIAGRQRQSAHNGEVAVDNSARRTQLLELEMPGRLRSRSKRPRGSTTVGLLNRSRSFFLGQKPGDRREVFQFFWYLVWPIARLARVIAIDVPLHVSQPGNGRRHILASDPDRTVS